jgi:hypothetical protein
MYCSVCGVAVAQGLSYCNYCGAKLNDVTGDDAVRSADVKPEFLVAAMVGLFVFGLVAIMLLMGMMKAVINLNSGQILGIAMVCFLTMISIEGVLVGLLLRRRSGTTRETRRLKSQTTKELDAAQARALPEHMPSVTEHTTRTFDPAYNPRTSK